MAAINRAKMAEMLIQEALDNGGELGVAVLEAACKKFLDQSKLQGLRQMVRTTNEMFPSELPDHSKYRR